MLSTQKFTHKMTLDAKKRKSWKVHRIWCMPYTFCVADINDCSVFKCKRSKVGSQEKLRRNRRHRLADIQAEK